MPTLAIILSATLTFISLGIFCLTMNKNYLLINRRNKLSNKSILILKIIGAIGLILSTIISIDHFGTSIGLVAQLASITLFQVLIALMLTYCLNRKLKSN